MCFFSFEAIPQYLTLKNKSIQVFKHFQHIASISQIQYFIINLGIEAMFRRLDVS